jgi:hypothetical protein
MEPTSRNITEVDPQVLEADLIELRRKINQVSASAALAGSGSAEQKRLDDQVDGLIAQALIISREINRRSHVQTIQEDHPM